MLMSILRGLERSRIDLNFGEVLKCGFMSAGGEKPLITRGNRHALQAPAIHRVDAKQGVALANF